MNKCKIALNLIILNLCIFIALIVFATDNFKINIRWLLFSERVYSSKAFKLNPTQLKEELKTFKIEEDKSLEKVVQNHPELLIPWEKKNDSLGIINQVKKIAVHFSKNGGPGCGNNSDDIFRNIAWVSEDNGHGCCSDHSQVFIAYALTNGIFAREVFYLGHTTDEFYDTVLQKWIWIDSEFCLMAKNANGNHLSIAEIQECYIKKDTIFWDFFGTPKHIMFSKSPNEDPIFQKENFSAIFMPMGNNIFEVDKYNQSTSWLPKSIKQFILITLEKQPSYLVYDPLNKFHDSLEATKSYIWLMILGSFGINISFLWYEYVKNLRTKNVIKEET